jgi:hypothetical protein
MEHDDNLNIDIPIFSTKGLKSSLWYKRIVRNL